MPTYPFDHTQSYWAESRLSKALTHRLHRPHQLLGTLCVEVADGEWRWRNCIRREEIEWLDSHQIESQTVLPATGYVAMALEAASIIAGKSYPFNPNLRFPHRPGHILGGELVWR